MATAQKDSDEVKGHDLLKQGLDAMFGKLGDLIHGAQKKKADENPSETTKEILETEGVSSSEDGAPKASTEK
jgi:hypothetical protein